MKKISFTKMVASGNDFVVIEKSHQSPVTSHQSFIKKICNRKFGIGADGVLLLEELKKADARPVRDDGCTRQPISNGVKMRIFNADGSEAEMCGNGARCAALYSARRQKAEDRRQKEVKIETKAGIIDSKVTGNTVKIRLTDPRDLKLDIPLKVNNRLLKVNFVNTGVPHTVVFCEGLEKIEVDSLGRLLRNHEQFKPKGTNVNFIEPVSVNCFKIRTYERGVEAETLACGTGSTAAALIFDMCQSAKMLKCQREIKVRTQSGEVLKVYFIREGEKFSDVWLEGKARIVYQGEYCL